MGGTSDLAFLVSPDPRGERAGSAPKELPGQVIRQAAPSKRGPKWQRLLCPGMGGSEPGGSQGRILGLPVYRKRGSRGHSPALLSSSDWHSSSSSSLGKERTRAMLGGGHAWGIWPLATTSSKTPLRSWVEQGGAGQGQDRGSFIHSPPARNMIPCSCYVKPWHRFQILPCQQPEGSPKVTHMVSWHCPLWGEEEGWEAL